MIFKRGRTPIGFSQRSPIGFPARLATFSECVKPFDLQLTIAGLDAAGPFACRPYTVPSGVSIWGKIIELAIDGTYALSFVTCSTKFDRPTAIYSATLTSNVIVDALLGRVAGCASFTSSGIVNNCRASINVEVFADEPYGIYHVQIGAGAVFYEPIDDTTTRAGHAGLFYHLAPDPETITLFGDPATNSPGNLGGGITLGCGNSGHVDASSTGKATGGAGTAIISIVTP